MIKNVLECQPEKSRPCERTGLHGESTDTGKGCPSYLPYAGVIAHHPGSGVSSDHEGAFRVATQEQGLDASSYFEQSGIAELADANEGLCTFWLGETLALYQSTNMPLVQDVDLAPSIDTNAGLFGSFMGALDSGDPTRVAKRAVVERVLGNSKYLAGLDEPIREEAKAWLAKLSGQPLALDAFSLQLIAHIDSVIPGILDLRDKPLTAYLDSAQYGFIAKSFFEIASEVISKMAPQAIKDAELVVDLTRDILEANFQSLTGAPAANMIRAQFDHFELPFTLASIRALSAEQLKELGTVIIATYDTTALSLLWSIAFLETHPHERGRLLQAIDERTDPLAVSSVLVLEALRLGGSNPSALWRRITRPVVIEHRGLSVTIPANTILWLDRRRANRDARVFPYADRFDARNIEQLMKTCAELPASVLARNRYEINSFSMVNAERNPRKCPGRLFAVRVQALVLVELYTGYEVCVSQIDTAVATHSSMPRPKQAGTITITPRR
ncbi:cytochrome P450 [Janthinobacterium sp. PAMC25594]|uniref:cytochrome P450 n=1 Tax=Janthinobacterium sp. PAMC25594 TaxID=2861284 RepID=UPI001C6384EB|nr:cytochrome P450 [Janthinobacterium sp. PAMC25594]QYG08886.1 cytochrome P450 [Janthinobacterium sp. PAMC25594]